MNSAVQLSPVDQAQVAWRGAVEKFAAAYGEFQQNQAKAIATGKIREWQEMSNKAATVQHTVAKIAGPVNTLYGWLERLTGGADRLQMIADGLGLSFLPKMPLAVINSSTGAIFLVTAQLNSFNRQIRG